MLYRLMSPRLYDPDTGANPAGAIPGEGTPNGNATGQEPPANGGTEKKPTLAEVLKQHGLQGELDAIIAERLAREERKRKEAEEKARKEAEERTLQEQGEFKTLAEQRAAELAEARAKLEAAAADKKALERYQSALKAQLEAARKDLPAHITALLDKLDPVEQLTWLAENREALGGDTPQSKKPARGTPGAQFRTQPPPQGQQSEQPRRRFTL